MTHNLNAEALVAALRRFTFVYQLNGVNESIAQAIIAYLDALPVVSDKERNG